MINKPLVSIIMPVYNAGKTLKKSLASLKGQTYKSLELLLIDDGSTDSSLLLLNDFKKSIERLETAIEVRVLSNDGNQGVAATRNRGIKESKGDYIYYVDADDWIDEDAIEKMVEAIGLFEWDIIGINWWLSFEKKQKLMRQPSFDSPKDALLLMMTGKMRWNLWLFMVRRDLYIKHDIGFLDGMDMGEDMLVMFKLFAVAEKVFYLADGLYHYGQSNEESLTKTYSENHRLQVSYNLEKVCSYLLSSAHKELIKRYIGCLKLNIKLPLLMTGDKVDLEIWKNWFPEVNDKYYSRNILPMRLTCLQWAANNKWMWWLVKLHYVAVVKCYYNILYKS